MTGFENLDGWEFTVLVGFQCAIVSVSVFLVGSFIGFAATAPGMTENGEIILNIVADSLNKVGTLFFFLSPTLISAGSIVGN